MSVLIFETYMFKCVSFSAVSPCKQFTQVCLCFNEFGAAIRALKLLGNNYHVKETVRIPILALALILRGRDKD